MKVTLDGNNLTINTLVELAATDDCVIEICGQGRQRLNAARKTVEKMLQEGQPVYGLNTGLGAKVTEKLSAQALSEFSGQLLRGRAHAIGEPMTRQQVRAAMIVRLNTLLLGASGACPAVADFIAVCLNRNIYPVIGNIGSIGAGDLCWGATMGLAFIGEGRFADSSGNMQPASAMLAQAGLDALTLAPGDGLALANHSSFSAAHSAMAVHAATSLLDSVQSATALTMEALRSNPSPLDPYVQNLAAQPGHIRAADQLRSLLDGSNLFAPGQAGKIQDALSIRNAVQVHGSACMALDFAEKIIRTELNSSSDNPIVDSEGMRMLSGGGYYSAHLTLATETVSRALDAVVVTQLARMSKLLHPQHSGLPQFLTPHGTDSNGFAPTLKIAEALVAEIRKLLAPVNLWPSVNANGVEDIQTHAPLAAKSLIDAVKHAEKLCALEMIMACQALDLGQRTATAPPAILALYEAVRLLVPKLEHDRPAGADIETLAQALGDSLFVVKSP